MYWILGIVISVIIIIEYYKILKNKKVSQKFKETSNEIEQAKINISMMVGKSNNKSCKPIISKTRGDHEK